jgi:hypothetical protein
MTYAIGIDPGTNGGIVVLNGDRVANAIKMPETPDAITDFLRRLVGDCSIFIEKIPKFCGAARFAERQIMGSSLAVLYGNYKLCVGICHGLGYVPRELVPLKWQNVVGCRNRQRLDGTAWKNLLKSHAQQLFPDFKVTLWSADALLIARAGQLIDKM